jgi:HemX protein
VSWPSDRLLFLSAVVLYGGAALFGVLVWRREFRQDQASLYRLVALGFVLHSLAMFRRGFSLERCPIRNLYEATLFVLWTITAAYLVLGAMRRLRFLGVFVTPLLFGVGVFALMPALDQLGPRPEFKHGWESLHATFILLAYGAFGLGSLSAVMYLLQDHNLKMHKARAVASLLPPITRLETVTGGALATGLALLSAGLVTGLIYLRTVRGIWISADPFILYSLLTWAVYLGLLVARWRYSQRGRRLAFGAVGGFAFVLLTFWGIYLLSGLHNQNRTAAQPSAATATATPVAFR